MVKVYVLLHEAYSNLFNLCLKKKYFSVMETKLSSNYYFVQVCN